jgi:DNA-binding NarL/FixJ family response regulator
MRKTIAIKIIVIDAQSIFLEGLLVKLRKFKEIKCTPAENGFMALKAMNAQPFDILLMDLELPGMSAWQMMEKMKS